MQVKYCRMLLGEHSAILLTCFRLPFVIKILVLAILEWPLKTGFTVHIVHIHFLRMSVFGFNESVRLKPASRVIVISWNIQILQIVNLAVILFRENNESTDQSGWMCTQFCTLKSGFLAFRPISIQCNTLKPYIWGP